MITAKELNYRTIPFLGLLIECERVCNDRAAQGYYYAHVDVAEHAMVAVRGVIDKLKTLGYKVELRGNNASDLNLLYISWEDA